MFNVGIAVLR